MQWHKLWHVKLQLNYQPVPTPMFSTAFGKLYCSREGSEPAFPTSERLGFDLGSGVIQAGGRAFGIWHTECFVELRLFSQHPTKVGCPRDFTSYNPGIRLSALPSKALSRPTMFLMAEVCSAWPVRNLACQAIFSQRHVKYALEVVQVWSSSLLLYLSSTTYLFAVTFEMVGAKGTAGAAISLDEWCLAAHQQ